MKKKSNLKKVEVLLPLFANDGDEQAKEEKLKGLSERASACFSFLSLLSLSKIDYIWRRIPCMEAKKKEKEVKEWKDIAARVLNRRSYATPNLTA